MRKRLSSLAVAVALGATPAVAAVSQIDPLYQPAAPAQERMLVLAHKLSARDDTAGAMAEYDKALALQPQWVVALTERAFLRERLGDLAGAMADYDAVLRLAPDRAKAWSHAAWIRALMNNDLDQALTYSDKAIALEPNIDVVDTRGFVHFRRGELAKAKDNYDTVLKAYPRAATTLYMRGVVEHRLGERAAGDADIAQALKLDDTIGAVWTKRGVTP